MSTLGLQAVALEARELVQAIRDEFDPVAAGRIVVSGMLAEQLTRQLAAGAEPGAVTVGDASELAETAVVVHVMAGEPSAGDDAVVRAADRSGVPVVLVQLWPQADWKDPFVLSAFVVECRAGEGFPLDEIATRIADAAVDHAPALASRIPVLRDAVTRSLVQRAMMRAAIIGAGGGRAGASRAALALEHARLLARLRTTGTHGTRTQELPVVAGVAAAAVAASLVFQALARKASSSFPAPFVNAAVTAGTTWAFGKAIGRFGR